MGRVLLCVPSRSAGAASVPDVDCNSDDAVLVGIEHWNTIHQVDCGRHVGTAQARLCVTPHRPRESSCAPPSTLSSLITTVCARRVTHASILCHCALCRCRPHTTVPPHITSGGGQAQAALGRPADRLAQHRLTRTVASFVASLACEWI
jgi:hypothetical protein